MAILQPQQFHTFLILVISILFTSFPSPANSVSFNFSTFSPNGQNIRFQGDAFSSGNVLQLTKNALDANLTRSTGRASYNQPIRLWDAKTGRVTDFLTHFSFVIKKLDTKYGDGISFFLAPFDSEIPADSTGGYLALYSNRSDQIQAVSVEYDTFLNTWDPSDNHVGININSIVSVTSVSWKTDMKTGALANSWISYNSTTKNLSVFLTYADDPVFGGNSTLSYIVDLRNLLPEWVRVGFSASTGDWVELHEIRSWDFSSSLEVNAKKRKNKTGLVIGLAGGIGFLVFGIGVFWFVYWRKGSGFCINIDDTFDDAMDDEFEKGTGPKRFTYRELSRATNNFSEVGKLGEGGFGGVYKGLLSESNAEVAVKRVSRTSKQGKKEYISEVKIISRLRHRNLVQLIGWCHENAEFLLVYEFMPNGSLDAHLFGAKPTLTWPVRYKIALGIASSLLYLHEEWEQCVVHRDIKSSNVMLDSNFNSKLGDFGLARLVDHDQGSQTTVLAGTMGYLAPECVTTGKASKESDVYSFGVVALEITCGRRPVEARQEPSRVRLVEWVWDMYGQGRVLEAVDKKLGRKYDERQVECLMVVGLWCCHPDFSFRPSIRQVINVLNFEATLPSLPAKLPVPMYYAPPLDMCKFTYTSTADGNTSQTTQCTTAGATTTTTTTTTTTSTSSGGSSSKALLNFKKS